MISVLHMHYVSLHVYKINGKHSAHCIWLSVSVFTLRRTYILATKRHSLTFKKKSLVKSFSLEESDQNEVEAEQFLVVLLLLLMCYFPVFLGEEIFLFGYLK